MSSPTPPSFDEKLQRDVDDVIAAIERLHACAPQLANQRARLTPVSNGRRPQSENLPLDDLLSVIDRMGLGRLDNQRASLPSLVAQGVTQMGWRVRNPAEQTPAETELLDRLERATARRFTDQCAVGVPHPEPVSPVALYLESIRETEANEAISICPTACDSPPAIPTQPLQASVSIATTSECSERARLLPDPVRKIFSLGGKQKRSPLDGGSGDAPAKPSIKRGLFGKKVALAGSSSSAPNSSFAFLTSLPVVPSITMPVKVGAEGSDDSRGSASEESSWTHKSLALAI